MEHKNGKLRADHGNPQHALLKVDRSSFPLLGNRSGLRCEQGVSVETRVSSSLKPSL